MQLIAGAKMKDKTREKWLPALTELLHPGEELTAVTTSDLLRPLCDGLAITNARIMAFFGSDLARKGLKLEVFASDIAEATINEKRGKHYLTLTRTTGDELIVAAVHKLDTDLVRGLAQQLAAADTPPDVVAAIATRAQQAQALATEQASAAQAEQERWSSVEVIGDAPSDKAWQTIRDHCSPGELPWFVVGVGSGGVFAAFDDRCMIIKVGALTSMMAGTLGGGRITTFPYVDISTIEYNAGFSNGVLEILTPSYQGTANKDYWRGSGKSANADANNPWTLSNTLPMGKPVYQRALPRLNELRAKITEAKRPTVTITAPTTPSPTSTAGLGDELTKLASLHSQGVLTDAEFTAAKQAAIERFSG